MASGKFCRARAAVVAALGAVAAVAGQAAARAQPSIVVPTAGGSGLPGATLIESMVSWAWWIAMLMSAVSFFLAGGAYGYFYWNSKSQQAGTALKSCDRDVGGGVVCGRRGRFGQHAVRHRIQCVPAYYGPVSGGAGPGRRRWSLA